jgi:hypothetical protein
MSHVVEIDQSGKFENTRQDTVLAFSNGIHFSVCIPAVVKRAAIAFLRGRGIRGETLYTRLFATTLFFLLKDHFRQIDRVYIDREYIGKEAQIKEHLLHLLRRSGQRVRPNQIQFKLIGKHSPAHYLALATFRSGEADVVHDQRELIGEFKATKKSGITSR